MNGRDSESRYESWEFYVPHCNRGSKINEAKLTKFQKETDKFMIGVGKSNPFSLKLLLQKKNYL